jgi:hypothetical protein
MIPAFCRCRYLLAPSLLGVVFVGWLCLPNLNADQKPTTKADPLAALNAHFREVHSRSRTERVAQASPVVLVKPGALVMIRQGKRTEVPFPPPLYHELKKVAHVPLSVFITLSSATDRKFDAVMTAEVRYMNELIAAALTDLEGRGYSPAMLERQKTILESTRTYLEGVLKNGAASGESLTAYARRMGPLMHANTEDAARAHLTFLNRQMNAWRAEMTDAEWNQLRAVVAQVHMARDGEISMQYFERILREPMEGHRVIYAEGLFEEPRALDLLGVHLLDGEASVAFFGDEMTLHRDVLAEGATKVINELTRNP